MTNSVPELLKLRESQICNYIYQLSEMKDSDLKNIFFLNEDITNYLKNEFKDLLNHIPSEELDEASNPYQSKIVAMTGFITLFAYLIRNPEEFDNYGIHLLNYPRILFKLFKQRKEKPDQWLYDIVEPLKLQFINKKIRNGINLDEVKKISSTSEYPNKFYLEIIEGLIFHNSILEDKSNDLDELMESLSKILNSNRSQIKSYGMQLNIDIEKDSLAEINHKLNLFRNEFVELKRLHVVTEKPMWDEFTRIYMSDDLLK